MRSVLAFVATFLTLALAGVALFYGFVGLLALGNSEATSAGIAFGVVAASIAGIFGLRWWVRRV